MSWFKVDDNLHGHPKAREAGLPALGLWVVAGAWSSAYSEGGHVSPTFVASWRRGSSCAEQLTKAGLWLHDGDGYVFHDWADFNYTTEEAVARRAADAARQRAYRSRRDNGVSHA